MAFAEASMIEPLVTEEVSDIFNFEEWTEAVGLNRKSVGKLRANDCITRETLVLLSVEDIRELELTVGQRNVLIAAITQLGATRIDSSDNHASTTNTRDNRLPNITAASSSQVTSRRAPTDEPLTCLLGELLQRPGDANARDVSGTVCMADAGNVSGSGTKNLTHHVQRADLDPLVYLSNPKPEYLDITDFVPQFSAGESDVEQSLGQADQTQLILKSGAKRIKLEHVNQAMYMAASSRILANLLQTGKLSHANVPHYLAYQVKIGMLAQRYLWTSVLLYDREYRRMQAAFNFPWGSDSQHLAQVHLIDKGHSRQVGRKNSSEKKQTCKLYNHSTCTYGENCKFTHLCSICSKNHPQSQHRQ